MELVQSWLNDPMVAPLYGLLVLSMFDWAVGSYAAWSGDNFTWGEAARVLRTTVLDRCVPVAFLGLTAFLSPTTEVVAGVSIQTAMSALYLGYAGLAIVSLLAGFREKYGNVKMYRALARDAEKVRTQTTPTRTTAGGGAAKVTVDKPIGSVPATGPDKKG